MSYNFQKWYYFWLFSLFLACAKDVNTLQDLTNFTPDNLKIEEVEGLRFDNGSISDGTNFNFKTFTSGNFILELKDYRTNLVSKERFSAKAGDNVLEFHTNALQDGDYTLYFYSSQGQLIQTEKLFIQ
jgi:hypothetical protein